MSEQDAGGEVRGAKGIGWIGRLLLAANVAAAVASAILVLAIYLAPDAASGSVQSGPGVFRVAVSGSTTFGVVALYAVALVVADFLWLVYGGRPQGPPSHVVSEGPGGPLRIARDALETGLRAAGEALDEISRVRVSVDATPGLKRIFLRAQFQAPENAAIHDASGRLRAALARRFHELVRLAEGVRLEIEIEFVGFGGKALRKASPEEPEAPAPDPREAFTGPRYPIGDEGWRDPE
ncbi:MAG: hypothetical protein IPM29_13175 [Planctomycetes bacterium]|nr:hypothetical protein [Planctomycetota bacterium]